MTASVAALFVDTSEHGIYPQLLGLDRCWGVDRDARGYAGPGPVVAHPPCQLWVNMAAVNWKRYGRQKPAWYPGGTDEKCFATALVLVRCLGGVLEHPADTHAWAAYDLPAVPRAGWHGGGMPRGMHRVGLGEWVCEVWQSAYGHAARKRTWLLYCGVRPPFEIRWERAPGTHQVGWFDRAKPTLSKRAASATPPAFAEELIRLSAWSRGTP